MPQTCQLQGCLPENAGVNPLPPSPASGSSLPPARQLPLPLRWLLMAFAVLCVVLGVIGIFVPGMPTTVFIIVAAWASIRSSPRFHAWLKAHPRFGPMLEAWENGGRVNRRIKWAATLTMSLSSVAIFLLVDPAWLRFGVLAIMAAVLAWLWLRPE